jgi:hypothetical protein
MAVVGMMQVPLDEVVRMVTVGYGLVTAARTVLVGRVVRATGVCRAARGHVRAADRDRALVDVVAVDAVKVAVVQVVGVPVMGDCGVSTPGAVLVRMVGVGSVLSHASSSSCSVAGASVCPSRSQAKSRAAPASERWFCQGGEGQVSAIDAHPRRDASRTAGARRQPMRRDRFALG